MNQEALDQDAQTPQPSVLAIQDTWETSVINAPLIIMNLLTKSVQFAPLVGFTTKEIK